MDGAKRPHERAYVRGREEVKRAGASAMPKDSSGCVPRGLGAAVEVVVQGVAEGRFTARWASSSILLPRTTNGKLSGSLGAACARNSAFHVSRLSKLLGAVMSNTRTHASAPR